MEYLVSLSLWDTMLDEVLWHPKLCFYSITNKIKTNQCEGKNKYQNRIVTQNWSLQRIKRWPLSGSTPGPRKSMIKWGQKLSRGMSDLHKSKKKIVNKMTGKPAWVQIVRKAISRKTIPFQSDYAQWTLGMHIFVHFGVIQLANWHFWYIDYLKWNSPLLQNVCHFLHSASTWL